MIGLTLSPLTPEPVIINGHTTIVFPLPPDLKALGPEVVVNEIDVVKLPPGISVNEKLLDPQETPAVVSLFAETVINPLKVALPVFTTAAYMVIVSPKLTPTVEFPAAAGNNE
jgi:hypothetical protein